MSRTKRKYEALRWLDTAVEDFEAARALRDKGKYSHACFLAQQCGERAVKALWFSMDEDPWGHSIQKLITDLPEETLKRQMEEVREEGSVLDRFYIPTRYPNGLPDLTPGKYYFQKDADLCIESATRILQVVKRCLEASSPKG